MNTKLEKWMRWLKIIHDDIRQLLDQQNIFCEVQKIIRNNIELHKSNSFYSFIINTYIAYVCIGIRRQIKKNKQSISFVRLLSEINDSPQILSRKYYKSLYENSVVERYADENFDKFCEIGENYISRKMIASDIETLKKITFKIEKFTDKRIAHFDKATPNELINFKDVDNCLETLNKLYVKYHSIFHAASHDNNSLRPSYRNDWKEIFEIPWIKAEEIIHEFEN